MRQRDDMTFPFEEYERRLRELRERMEQRKLDAVVICDPENLMYLTDHQTSGYSFFQALVVPIDDEPFSITRAMEESNIIERTWVEKTRTYPDTGDAIQMLSRSLDEAGLQNKTIGYERNSYFVPSYQQDRIRAARSGDRLMDCFGIVEEGRIRKSPAELDVMRKAARATEAGMRAGMDACAVGVTENDIAAAISSAMFRAGGEFPAVMPYVTSGPRTMIGHATWEGRTVQAGEHVFLEVGGCYRRYHTAMMRTVLLGEMTDSMYRAQERMKLALAEVKAAIQPGMTVSDADQIVRTIITENTVGARLITRAGYSIGIAFPPSWDEGYILSLKQGDATVLEEGMTLHIIPWMWGVDGDKTCGISDTIYITENGCESFFTLEEDFVCKPEIGEGGARPTASSTSILSPFNAAPSYKEPLRVVDPTHGTIVKEVMPHDEEQVEETLARSAAAYAEWKQTSFDERAKLLRAVASALRDQVERLAPIMTEEMGKPIKEARGEVNKSAWCAEHYAERAADYLADEEIASDATRSYVRYAPLGPTLGILPWNAPFWLAFRYCAPALMAGNTCILKHDPHCPISSQAIVDLFEEAGAPEGVMQHLLLQTRDVEKVIRDRRIQAVSFTGSSRGGASVAAIAASEIKPTVLELGGSDPSVVLSDADLDEAADVITLSRIINAGQSCIAAKRIIVEDDVYDEMVERLASRLGELTVGDPREESTDVGPIARKELRENLHRQVHATISAGARCLLGGECPTGRGFFYPVTLLADVTPDMVAFCEETFGPVAVVIRADDVEHAISMANDTEYGLGASVWTETERGEQIAHQLVAGQVSVNGIVKTDPRLPSGGVKKSGYGRELGPHGIREFVNAKQIWIGPKQS